MKKVYLLIYVLIGSVTWVHAQNTALELKANAGDAESMFQLAMCYRRGQSVNVDQKECVFWLKKAVEKGHTKAQYYLASYYEEGEGGLPVDSIKAYTLMKSAAEKGDLYAMYALGFSFVPSTIDKSLSISTKWLETYVEKSKDDLMCSAAELELYYRYQEGGEIEKNISKALSFLMSAVNRGPRSSPEAYNEVGECYYQGKYLSMNRDEAIRYFKLSADNGCGLGMANLGEVYYKEKNFSLAYKYLKSACEDEFQLWPSPKAMLYLSHCYRYGLGGAPKSEEQAKYWFEQSLKHKERTAMELFRLNRKESN